MGLLHGVGEIVIIIGGYFEGTIGVVTYLNEPDRIYTIRIKQGEIDGEIDVKETDVQLQEG